MQGRVYNQIVQLLNLQKNNSEYYTKYWAFFLITEALQEVKR